MSQALNPPLTSSLDELTGLDRVLWFLQDSLSTIDWLGSNSFGRIKPQYEKSELPKPWIYKGNGEYYPAYPNDTLTVFSGLFAHDDEETVNEYFKLRTLSVIVWANLNTLNRSLESMKQDVERVLRVLHSVKAVTKIVDQTAVGPTGIYPGFDVTGLEARYITAPYGAFRVICTIHWTDTDEC